MRPSVHLLPLLLLLLLSGIEAKEAFHSKRYPGALKDAHDAYLRQDFKRMVVRIRSLFEQGADSYALNNALELLDRTQGLLGSNPLPVDWALPPDIKRLDLVLRTDTKPEGTTHSVSLEGLTWLASRPLSVRLQKAPTKVVLDLEGGQGQWNMKEVGKGGKLVQFSLSKATQQPLSQGLYYIKLKLKNRQIVNGWVILSKKFHENPSWNVSKDGTENGKGNTNEYFHHREFQNSTGKEQGKKPWVLTSGDEPESKSSDNLEAYRNAARRKILEMRKSSDSSMNSSTRGTSRNILRLNHREVQRFGDLVLRREISSEVYLDP